MSELSGRYPLSDLLECAGLARSSYYFAISHPKVPTRPELWEEAGVVQSMSRKGNCIDNGATEQVFGHLKDEFFRDQVWPSFDAFKRDLDAYIVHWNTRRRQVKLKGLTPEEFRNQSLLAA